MTTVLFVDSDASALNALEDSVVGLRPGWVICKATTGKQALEILKSQVIDVIVSETRLPDISGFDLLGNVRTAYPETIRLTFSEDHDAEIVMESARANHRFIAKPVSLTVLTTAIDCSLRLRKVLHSEELEQFVSNIESIPALPEIYSEMMTELASPQGSLLNVGTIVERDTGLTVTVLKIVNSTFYGLSQRVESVAQGVALLGVHLIKNITLTAKVFSQFEGSQLNLRRLSLLNDQAIKMGALSNQFGRYAKVSRSTVDHSQMSGMLANIGELIVAMKSQDQPEVNGFSNEFVGAYLLRLWLLPDAIVEAVALQHESPPVFAESVTPLVILHSIRYLQGNFTNVTDDEQRQACQNYLESFVPEAVVDLWLNAYQDLEQLTS
jgi:HD-like signal output (HDOD) protein